MPRKKPEPKLSLNVTKPNDTEHLNAVIYGVSGAGKTHLLGTAIRCEETDPPLILDAENGTRTLRGIDVDVVRPQSWKEIQDLYEYFLYENNKYKSLLIDSITEVQKRYSMGMILGEMEDDRLVYTNLGSVGIPTRRDWGQTGEQMRKVIRSFRDLAYLPDRDRRVHVIFTALEKYVEKKDLICPSLIGGLGEDCGALVDFMLRLSRENTIETNKDGEDIKILRRYLLTDDHLNDEGTLYMGKNRGRNLPKGIWDPDMDKLIRCIQNGNGGTNAE